MHRVVLLQQHVERAQRLVPSTTQLTTRLLLMNVTVVSHVLLLQLAEIGPLIKDVRGCRRCNLLIDPLRRFLICEETAVTHLLQILLLLKGESQVGNATLEALAHLVLLLLHGNPKLLGGRVELSQHD